LADNPAGIRCETLPIVPDLPTWWGKLTLFGHPIPGRILYFDLDTVIVGNIDGFAAYDGPFCLIKPFYRGRGFASGVMSIGPDFGSHVWDRFARDPRSATSAQLGPGAWAPTWARAQPRSRSSRLHRMTTLLHVVAYHF